MTSVFKRIKSLISRDTLIQAADRSIPFMSKAQKDVLGAPDDKVFLGKLSYHEYRMSRYGARYPSREGKWFNLEKYCERTFVESGSSGHQITIAPCRSGTTTGLIIPNVLTYSGPVVVFDRKGEVLSTCGRQRSQRRKVIAIDPFQVCKDYNSDYRPDPASYNVFDFIEEDKAASDICNLADALFTQYHSRQSGEHRTTAKTYVSGLIHYVYSKRDEYGEQANILAVRDLLAITDENELSALWEKMHLLGGLAKSAANTMQSHIGSVDLYAILKVAADTLVWLNIPELARVVEKSTFSLDDVNNDKADLFISIPAHQLTRARGLMSVFASLTLLNSMRKPSKRKVLTIIDEAPLLGRLEPVVNAYHHNACKVWLFSHTMEDLKIVYGERDFYTMFHNADMISLMGRLEPGFSIMKGHFLVDPNMRIAPNEIVLLLQNNHHLPVKIERVDYHSDDFEDYAFNLTGKSKIYDDNPHSEIVVLPPMCENLVIKGRFRRI